MFTFLTEAAAPAAGEQGAASLGAGAMLEMLLWLVVVVGFILACAWAYKRLNGGVLAPAGVIKVRSVMQVGSRERIALVEVGATQLLIGVCPTQISTLHVFHEPVLPLAEATEQGGRVSSEFASRLQSLLNKEPRS
jgi:flagellar protein FliO/FliZ